MEKRITDLEIRIAHQEASIEELTQSYLQQQQQLQAMQVQIEYLRSLLKDMSNSAVRPQSEESPPPHY